MNKLIKFAGVCTAVAMLAVSAVSMTACGHTHKWEWHRTETEHWQTCSVKGCEEERNRGTHEDSVCDDCAEFKALAFGYTQGGDGAHADFAREANKWFPDRGKELGFIYHYASDFSNSTSSDFSMMTDETLENYNMIVLLNDKPNSETSQAAFKKYMDNGGACVVFHSAGFAMWDDPDVAPTEFEDWYSNTLLRCGVYGECNRRNPDEDRGFTQYWNTWNPTSEPMTIETHNHFATESIEEDEFMSAPCEWYEWYNDLFEDDGTTVLVSMNPTPENPAGDDNRKGAQYEHQIWESGHHAIAWANKDYNMVYMNWGHNLQDYNIATGSPVGKSETFSSKIQNQITLNAMFGLIKNK